MNTPRISPARLLALSLLFAAPLPAAPFISEFLAENSKGLRDADGDFSDWIEVQNPDTTPVVLTNWCLTDDPAQPARWRFPAVTLAPGESVVVFASGKNRTLAGQELHTNFSLNNAGEYLALVRPDGTTVAQEFAPKYPAQRADISYGVAQVSGTHNLIASALPHILIPASAASVPADWVTPGGAFGSGAITAAAPGTIGYDIEPAPDVTFDATRLSGVTATQSSGIGTDSYPASRALDGLTTNFSHTSGVAADPNPWWQCVLTADTEITAILLTNRTACCQTRLRDVTVQILSDTDAVLWTSPMLNPDNAMGGPAVITVDVKELAGHTVTGRKVKVSRTGNPALTSDGDRYALALAEVTVRGVDSGGEPVDRNVARDAGVSASQSTTNSSFAASLAIDGNTANFSHTQGTDPAPEWTLDLGAMRLLSDVTIGNRTSCCGSRLRDITVTVRDAENAAVFTSPLLNPENAGYSYPSGPPEIRVDLLALAGGPVAGRYLEISRTPDGDLSGTGGQGSTDEQAVLALGEVTVMGTDFGSYQNLLTTDVKAAMRGTATSAMIRYPFTLADPSTLRNLRMRIRYDDGFVAWLNGVEIGRRNAPAGAVPAWNAAALTERADTSAFVYETLDGAAALPFLVTGQNVLAIQAMTAAVDDPDFLLTPELLADGISQTGFPARLRVPSPGVLNDSEWFIDWVKDTNFSVKRGFYDAPVQVAITSATPDARIYYSTNAEDPAPGNGTLYTGPVTVSRTTVLRARAFKDNWEPTNTDTNTYLFLPDVLTQAANGAAPAGWPSSWGGNSVNYGMDPDIRNLYGDEQLIEALRQIPSISVTSTMADLFDPATGIYSNADGHGDDWEKPCSMEWLNPDGTPGRQGEFQVNCGLRIRGGYSRNDAIPKHSFRVYFRGSYGASKLRYPIYGDRGTDEYDVIDLASSQNYSWAREASNQDTMLRDPLARETQVATGSPGCRNRYFHLYLNGLYWGVYYFDERPSAGFGAAYFGGSNDTWDVIKTGNHNGGFATEATEGYMDTLPPPEGGGAAQKAAWRVLWDKARAFARTPGVTSAGNPDLAAYFDMLGQDSSGQRDPAREVLVDRDSLINYMLNIFWSGDGDAPLSAFLSNEKANNWFCIRNREGGDRGFIFFTHDAEHTFAAPSSQNNRTGPFPTSASASTNQNNFAWSNPQWLFQDLCFSPEFRIRVADLAHKHMFNGGVMTGPSAQARVDWLSGQIDKAVKAHSMRWGDTQRSTPYNATDWRNAVNTVRNYVNTRSNTVVTQLKQYRLTAAYPLSSAPLYPPVAAPSYNQHGGTVAGGFSLTMTSADTAGGGVIYYTLDGTDPRAIGGAVAAGALTYAAPVTLTAAVTARARTLKAGTWSALNEAAFSLDTVAPVPGSVLFSAVHYHPGDPLVQEILAGFTDADDFEYLELFNPGATALNLTDCYFADGITYTFPLTTLAAGGRLVLVRNPDAFALRYPGVPVAGQYAGALNNGGETLTLKDAAGVVITSLKWKDNSPWPATADGDGPAMVLIAPGTNPDPANPLNWRAGSTPGGTPGTADPGTSYAAWKAANGVSSDSANPDGDSLLPPLEYLTGSDPARAEASPVVPLWADPDGTFTFTVPRASGADDAALEIEVSDGLGAWAPATGLTLTGRDVQGGREVLTFTLDPAVPATVRRFVRVKATIR